MDLEDKRKDITLILKINQTFDLTKTAEAKKVYSYVQDQKPFRTQIGQVYQARLQRLSNGNSQDLTCLFCKSEYVPNGIICPNCIDKLTGKNRKTQTAEVPKTPDSLSELSEKTASAVRSATNGAEKALSFYHKLSRKNKIIAASVCVIIFLLLITVGQAAVSDSSSFAGSGSQSAGALAGGQSSAAVPSIHDQESAREFLEQVFPPENYSISPQQTLQMPIRMFEGQVGKARKFGDYGSLEKVTTHVFFVLDTSTYEHATLWVSETGRIIGYGTMLFGTDDTSYFLRLL